MGKKAKLGLAGLGVAVVLAVGATVAMAVRYETTLTIDSLTTAGASGTVSSGHTKCVKNRLVRLWMRTTPGGPTTFVGSDRTDDAGHWQIDKTLVPGNYLARTHRRIFRRRPHRPRIHCLPDNSGAQTLSG